LATPSTHKYEQQRQTAIRAAASVFAEKGFHGACTKDIAERMGIKQGSLYYYFKSKEEALGEVCLYGIQDYVEHMATIAASDQPFAAKLVATVTSHLSSYRERDEALKVYNDERLYLPASRRSNLKSLGSEYRRKLEGIFEQGKASGAVRQSIDCNFAAHAVIGMCNAWGDLIVRDSDLELFTVIQNCTDLLINGFTNKSSKDI